MPVPTEMPAEADVRFLGYRLDVISQWPPSARKTAVADAVSRRLTDIARSALARPDVEGLLNLSCRLLDDFFQTSNENARDLPAAEAPRDTESAVPSSTDAA